ncbi:MAG: DUF5069 domain-containing protein [Verrucomicrobia bacterium]|nr:MAG: DUF5069 domain-containing protein [Verrucomicrobiota bacterium]
MTWNDYFTTLFDSCCASYHSGTRDFEKFYTGEDRAFLATIGYQAREFFDFVEDFCDAGTPSATTALLVAAVRRDYFLSVQHGITSQQVLTSADLPSFGHELAGLVYLPRILAKARAKLRGELDPDIMFGCGGDRNFLRQHGCIPLADFLHHVWAAGDNDAKLAAWVKAQST